MRTTIRMMTVGAALLSIFAIITCDNIATTILCGLSLFALGTVWEVSR